MRDMNEFLAARCTPRSLGELARHDAKDTGARNVEYHVADARVFDGGPFDLVYGRPDDAVA
jgi:hypothetical protein